MAERMGETFLRAVSLLTLTLTALRQHDTEAVRVLLPRAAAAVENADTPLTGVMACRGVARLAGRPPGRGDQAGGPSSCTLS